MEGLVKYNCILLAINYPKSVQRESRWKEGGGKNGWEERQWTFRGSGLEGGKLSGELA